ncbi:undecaprenyl-diphosphate phosphatase [Cohnella endophytica]|uniref:Undecaprenyl-diphosphatase n=1 Tax=Cohnella endophytica TaxID=2419778 RepID=A0A494XWM8_9BACL|nr:undecaprenyl-diphosphate phosphatase [Cohnella endophytica]RKP55007.1 undecaprenyl-diphosphate phosphatase [Cohnella endophytica]
MDYMKSIIFAIIQGISELFPISSVAHGVFTPYVFHWNLSQEFLKDHFLPYVVMLHVGTALALLVFFRREWLSIARSLFNVRDKDSRRLLALIIVATLPAALIGVTLEKNLRHLFSSVTSASVFLMINGVFLFFGEKIRSRGNKEINDLTFGQAFIVGLFQSLALIPGFSRSGSSMIAGFWAGLKHESAARFSMLLATPIIAGAGVLEIRKLAKSGMDGLFRISLVGGAVAAVVAYITVWLLMKWFKKHEIQAMRPFAYYCWAVGAIILLTSIFH